MTPRGTIAVCKLWVQSREHAHAVGNWLGCAESVRGRGTMPHGRVFEFDDPFQLQATLRAGDYEVLPTSKGGFRSTLTRIDFERLWLQRCETSAGSLLRTANHPTRAPMTFLADPTQAPWQQNGAELPDDGVAVYRQGALNHHYARTENRWASMSLT